MASDEFRLASRSISNEGRLPRKYTEEGQGSLKNISPPLEWYNVPQGTKSLALLVQDIDAPTAPNRPWVCWLLINIPPHLNTIPDGFSGNNKHIIMDPEYEGITEGLNDLKVPGWRAPKLPDHPHRLEFKLYALDHLLHLGQKVTKDKVMEAIEGHVLGEAVLIAMH